MLAKDITDAINDLQSELDDKLNGIEKSLDGANVHLSSISDSLEVLAEHFAKDV